MGECMNRLNHGVCPVCDRRDAQEQAAQDEPAKVLGPEQREEAGRIIARLQAQVRELQAMNKELRDRCHETEARMAQALAEARVAVEFATLVVKRNIVQ